MFLPNGSGFQVNPHVRLPYGNEYGELGLNRTIPIPISLDAVNGAVDHLYHANANAQPDSLKKPLRIVCLAFAEAVRFDDVLMDIIMGRDITDLDWTQHSDQSKVRVIQS